MMEITIYTDGACRGNPGRGGWGAILVYGKYEKEMSGGEKNTTNNRMELTAVIEGLNTTYNQSTAALRRWTFEGQQTDMPKACYMESEDWRNNERFSDRWIEDGSYFRVKSIKLSYDVPLNLNWLQGLTVWCAAENVYTFTDYKGMDPEFSVSNNVLYQGIDNGLLGQSRSFHLGVKINL